MVLDITFLPQVGAFLFVFAVVLGLLTTAKLFNKNVNAALAAVFGLFSAIYEPFVSGIQTYLPIAAGILIVLFFFVFVKKLFEKKEGEKGVEPVPLAVVLISLLVVLISQWDKVKGFLPAGIDATNAGWILGIVAILIVIWAAYKYEPGQAAAPGPGPRQEVESMKQKISL